MNVKWKFLYNLNNLRNSILKTHSKYLKSPNLEILGGIIFGDDAVAPPPKPREQQNNLSFHPRLRTRFADCRHPVAHEPAGRAHHRLTEPIGPKRTPRPIHRATARHSLRARQSRHQNRSLKPIVSPQVSPIFTDIGTADDADGRTLFTLKPSY